MTDSVHECAFAGSSGQGGCLAGCSIFGRGIGGRHFCMCGQGHGQSGSLKVQLKMLS